MGVFDFEVSGNYSKKTHVITVKNGTIRVKPVSWIGKIVRSFYTPKSEKIDRVWKKIEMLTKGDALNKEDNLDMRKYNIIASLARDVQQKDNFVKIDETLKKIETRATEIQIAELVKTNPALARSIINTIFENNKN